MCVFPKSSWWKKNISHTNTAIPNLKDATNYCANTVRTLFHCSLKFEGQNLEEYF